MESTDFDFGIHGKNDPILNKEKVADFMKKILNDDGFSIILQGKRENHSIRKMVTKRSRRCGCSKDETNTRALWKQRRQRDSYADTILPWPDAKFSAALCKGVPIHYRVRVHSGISEDWILNFVAPVIASKYC